MGDAEAGPALGVFVIHRDALLQDSLLYIDLLGRKISRDNTCTVAEYHDVGRKRSRSACEQRMLHSERSSTLVAKYHGKACITLARLMGVDFAASREVSHEN
jgi:hypothetical protein